MNRSNPQLSIHSALWVERWGEDLSTHIARAGELGFDGVEVSLLGLDSTEPSILAHVARDSGVSIKCTTGLSADSDISSLEVATRRRGVDYLRQCADVVATLGADLLTGVIYAPWGTFGTPATRQTRMHWAAESLAAVAPEFAQRGITLGIEAINRFETDLINTADQALALADEIGAPNVGVHLDTFHMNIEERNVHAAVTKTASRLVHVHISGSDRGRPIAENFQWDSLFRALRVINYQQWIGVEMFVQSDIPVSSDLRIWRPIELSPDDAAASARQFILERISSVND